MKKFLLMLGFLTSIPVHFSGEASTEEFGKALRYAPLVGAVIGGLLAIAYFFCSMIFPQSLSVLLVIVLYLILTGGLHIDGVGDTFDGLMSHRSRDRILEIMRDSRLGTHGLLAIVVVLSVDVVSLNSLSNGMILSMFLIMPVMGRLGSVTSAGLSIYARQGEGLGKAFIDFCGWKEVLWGFILAFTFSIMILGTKGIIFPFVSFLFSWGFVKWVTEKIGGMTGDTCGACCELVQMITLLVAIVIFKA